MCRFIRIPVAVLLISGLLVSVSGAPCALAAAGPPSEFRGIPFGAALAEVPGLTPVAEKVKRNKQAYEGLYFREDEDLHFEGADVRSVAYHFVNDRLHSVIVAIQGDADAFLIKDALIRRYGPGRQIGRRYGWTWDKFSLVVERAPDADVSVLTYTLEVLE